MEIKKGILIIIFSIYSFYINSQESKPFYSFTQTENTFSFFQTLTWEEVEYAKSYELVLERKNDLDRWEPYETYSLETSILEISLNPGTYKYNISVWNPLNRKEPPSKL